MSSLLPYLFIKYRTNSPILKRRILPSFLWIWYIKLAIFHLLYILITIFMVNLPLGAMRVLVIDWIWWRNIFTTTGKSPLGPNWWRNKLKGRNTLRRGKARGSFAIPGWGWLLLGSTDTLSTHTIKIKRIRTLKKLIKRYYHL